DCNGNLGALGGLVMDEFGDSFHPSGSVIRRNCDEKVTVAGVLPDGLQHGKREIALEGPYSPGPHRVLRSPPACAIVRCVRRTVAASERFQISDVLFEGSVPLELEQATPRDPVEVLAGEVPDDAAAVKVSHPFEYLHHLRPKGKVDVLEVLVALT